MVFTFSLWFSSALLLNYYTSGVCHVIGIFSHFDLEFVIKFSRYKLGAKMKIHGGLAFIIQC